MHKRNLHTIELTERQVSLIGFAIKSRSAEFGFEAAKRDVLSGKAAFILLSEEIAEDSAKKMRTIAHREGVPVYSMKNDTPWRKKLGIERYKIITLRRGPLAKGFFKNVK